MICFSRMDISLIAKWVLSGGGATCVACSVRYVLKLLNDRRERIILDLLEKADNPLGVSTIENEFRARTLTDMSPLRYLSTVRPGGSLLNEEDHVLTKIPLRLRTRYWWRLKVMRAIPTEEKVRDILRVLKTRGLVQYAGDDTWRLDRK